MSDPRHDDAAERIVLGAMMASERIVAECLATGITASDFYRPAHEIIFDAIVSASAAGEPHGPEELCIQLANDLRRIGGAPYLMDVYSAAPTPQNGPWFARVVIAEAKLRKLQELSTWLEQAVGTADTSAAGDVEELIQTVRAEVDGRTAARDNGDVRPFADLLLEAAEHWEKPDTTVLPTGWHDLDQRLNGGLRPGHLCVLGARPAVGKSVAASVLAAFAAGRGVGTLFVSLEMPHREVVDRVAANVAGIDLSRLIRSELTDVDWQRVARLQSQAASWPLWVDDRPGNTVQGIRGRARDLAHSKSGLGLIVVDYLQIVRCPDRRLSREQAVSEITKGLRAIGRELEVPVVALAQVNRESTRATDQRPTMAQLRESGAIEADADEVILLHRDDEESPGEIEFNLEKCRNGRTGRVTLAWAPHYSRIASFARYDEAAS
ncbi:MAG: replicative DNA helicase [Motilibacteraceae bacterium]